MPPPSVRPADAGRRDDPARRGQPERVRRVIEVSPCGAAAGAGSTRLRIDVDVPHEGQVDYHPGVVGAEPRRAVPAATD